MVTTLTHRSVFVITLFPESRAYGPPNHTNSRPGRVQNLFEASRRAQLPWAVSTE